MVRMWILFGVLLVGYLAETKDPLSRHINKGSELVQHAAFKMGPYLQAPARLTASPVNPDLFSRKVAGFPHSARLTANVNRRFDHLQDFEENNILTGAEAYSEQGGGRRSAAINPETFHHSANTVEAWPTHAFDPRKSEVYRQQFETSPVPQPPPPPLDFNYHNYTVMTNFLEKIALAYPNLAKLYSIGKSVQGRDLWVVMLTGAPYRDDVGKPNVKIVGNIHGNEAVGREIALHMIEYLVVRYQTEPYVKWLLDHTKVHILPSLNPDGFEVSREGSCHGGQGRYNAMGFDLNRNFPDYFKTNMKQPQPETEAYKTWLQQGNFVLSASLHGGALVVSYPFDNSPNALTQPHLTSPALTPDNDVFRYLATSYASTHPTMHLGLSCKPGAPAFPNGTINGAAWYPLIGGAQDYNYIWGGCLEVTIEMTCCKYPPAAELPKHWEDHRLALLQFLGEARRGVRGLILDTDGSPVPQAEMRIRGRDVGFKSSARGEYWRLLLPGEYVIEIYKEGFEPREVSFAVEEGQPTILNVALKRIKRAEPVHNNIESIRRQGSTIRKRTRPVVPSSEEERKDEANKSIIGKFTRTLASILGR